MGQSTEELKRDIESTRSDLGDTLDAIGDRVSPSRVIERRKNRMTAGFRSLSDRVMGTASDARGAVDSTAGGAVDSVKQAPGAMLDRTEGNPVAAGIVAFGLGFLAAAVFRPTAAEERTTEQLMAKAQPLKDELISSGKEVAEQLKQPAQEAMEQVKQTATEGGQQVAETAKSAAGDAKSTAQDAADNVRSQTT